MSQYLLVINVQDQVLNILMPGQWLVNGESLAYAHALRLVLEKDDHAITAYLAYALDFRDVTATELLPFSVEVYATD